MVALAACIAAVVVASVSLRWTAVRLDVIRRHLGREPLELGFHHELILETRTVSAAVDRRTDR